LVTRFGGKTLAKREMGGEKKTNKNPPPPQIFCKKLKTEKLSKIRKSRLPYINMKN